MSSEAPITDKEPELTDEQILELEQRIKDEEALKVKTMVSSLFFFS